MSNPVTGNKKKKIKPIRKPYLKGTLMSRAVVMRALKLMVYPLIFVLINLFIGAAFSFDSSPILRVTLNVALIGFCVLLLFSTGQSAGYDDITIAEIMYTHVQEGKAVTKEERDRCFHPLKGAVTAAIAYVPLLIVTLVYAFTVRRQVFTLPSLPGWVSSYVSQESFMLPLQYYQVNEPITAANILQLVMRLLLYPYINLVGARNAGMVYLMDRLSPLTMSIPFIGYAIGYVFGRRSRAIMHGNIAAADRKRRKKARQKVRKTSGKTELV